MAGDLTMQCPACQAELASESKFCSECGARLRIVCAACGQPSPAGKKFCAECGASLTAAPPAPPSTTPTPGPTPAAFREAAPVSYTPKHLAEKILTSKGAIEGERKVVTVMFSDVSGFTAMSEQLDPEEVHAIMDRVFEVILGAVHHHEGTINQFLGDGVMALFGAPIAHEDHAQRALSAALEIQESLKPVAEDVKRAHGLEFRMRMGINTGPVVVGAIGRDLRMDYTAVGDTTNLAARLLAIAKPGQIVTSRRTQHMRDRFFTFEDLGEFQVKGKSEPVRAYAVTGERRRTRLEVSKDRGLSPLVGRGRELGLLNASWARAFAGQGAVAVVSGEAGVGKSRLLYEFLHGLEGTGLVELETTCVSYGRAIPYRPILELLRRYLDLTEGMPPAEVRGRIIERLQDLGLEGEERTILLAHFVGVSAPQDFLNRLSAAELKERTIVALRDVFLHASRAAPVVLLIENVHWLDASSAEFLGRLAAGLPGHRILLLLSTRPGFVPWATLASAETIMVDALGGEDVEGMAKTLLGVSAMSRELSRILAEKGEGNPLYVEEIVHQLQETGGIVVEGGQARLGSPGGVPATIHDIIAARVDRLADALKLTLQGGAVVGRRFGTSLVSRVIASATDEVVRNLGELHGLDFVFPAAQDPELMYSFKHALTQDVVYAGLLDRRRRQYHAAAALGLEELYVGHLDDVVDLLAYHFGSGGENEKAVDYTILAAEKAQRRWANPEALAYFDGAVKRLETMPDTEANRLRRVDAVVKQAELMFALGRHGEHLRALEAIRGLVDASADPPRRAAWCYWTGFFHSLTGARPDVAIAHCREALKIADANGLDEIRAFAECCLTHVYAVSGDLREGLAAGERALEMFEARGNVWWACRTLWGLMSVANGLGEWPRSLEYCRRALEYGQTVNDLRLRVVGWWRTASTHVQRGDTDASLKCCEEALALSPTPFDAAMIRTVRGYGLIKVGDVDRGVLELEGVLEWLERSHLGHFRAACGYWLAEGYLRRQERGRARALVEGILAAVREESRRAEGVGERLLGECLLVEDPTAAAGHLETAARILKEIGARNELARALSALGEVKRVTGDVAGARQLLERALATFEELGTLDEPPRVRAVLAALPAPTA